MCMRAAVEVDPSIPPLRLLTFFSFIFFRSFCLALAAAGQLGLGKDVQSTNRPLLIRALLSRRIVSLAADQNKSGALTAMGEAYTWGHDSAGQIGHGGMMEPQSMVWEPRLVQALRTQFVTKMAMGYRHSVFLTRQGQLYACGFNDQYAAPLTPRHVL
jgi:alpha-tubulin suppressor-like RCC1 family protein